MKWKSNWIKSSRRQYIYNTVLCAAKKKQTTKKCIEEIMLVAWYIDHGVNSKHQNSQLALCVCIEKKMWFKCPKRQKSNAIFYHCFLEKVFKKIFCHVDDDITQEIESKSFDCNKNRLLKTKDDCTYDNRQSTKKWLQFPFWIHTDKQDTRVFPSTDHYAKKISDIQIILFVCFAWFVVYKMRNQFQNSMEKNENEKIKFQKEEKDYTPKWIVTKEINIIIIFMVESNFFKNFSGFN